MRDKESAILAGLLVGNAAAILCVYRILDNSLTIGAAIAASIASVVASASSYDAGKKWCSSSWRTLESRRTWVSAALMGLTIAISTNCFIGLFVAAANILRPLNEKNILLLALLILALTQYTLSIGLIVALASFLRDNHSRGRGFELQPPMDHESEEKT